MYYLPGDSHSWSVELKKNTLWRLTAWTCRMFANFLRHPFLSPPNPISTLDSWDPLRRRTYRVVHFFDLVIRLCQNFLFLFRDWGKLLFITISSCDFNFRFTLLFVISQLAASGTSVFVEVCLVTRAPSPSSSLLYSAYTNRPYLHHKSLSNPANQSHD